MQSSAEHSYEENEQQQGARARAPRPGDTRHTPSGLRFLTWLGVAFLVAAVLAFTVHLQTSPNTGDGYDTSAPLDPTVILIGVLLFCTGIVIIAIRIAAGVIVHTKTQPKAPPMG